MFHSSFGLEHIWARHGRDITSQGYETKDQVADYVAAIIQPGTQVFDEGLPAWQDTKLFALRGSVGYAVLKTVGIPNHAVAYSVTTAYKNPRKGRISRLLCL